MIALELEQAAGHDGAVTADDRTRVRQRVRCCALHDLRERIGFDLEQLRGRHRELDGRYDVGAIGS